MCFGLFIHKYVDATDLSRAFNVRDLDFFLVVYSNLDSTDLLRGLDLFRVIYSNLDSLTYGVYFMYIT